MSDNRTKPNVKGHHGANSSLNDMYSSVKAQNSSLHSMNSSFDSSILNMSAKSKESTKNRLDPRRKKTDVTGVITHFLTFNNSERQCFTISANSSYYRGLSKLNSDLPSRKPLAFFVPDNSADSQAVSIQSSTALRAHLSVSRGQTIISIANHLLTDYDGLTLQNKIAVRRICGAVTVKTESKTRHPIHLYSVAHTQKLTGGYHA
ncbi:hypothetical protein [Psychrobacter sp. JB385]|uniref:hypothetical protein n=1 Tax=Psychrobacter sp. JB385 TaxID=1434841 RepID=UPI00097EAA34|nr:hypothetical protein [Psychrobacter sp. JB385]SJN35236.1 hypothetical protein CZ794_08825 [Psychrobacter sp. JB385]